MSLSKSDGHAVKKEVSTLLDGSKRCCIVKFFWIQSAQNLLLQKPLRKTFFLFGKPRVKLTQMLVFVGGVLLGNGRVYVVNHSVILLLSLVNLHEFRWDEISDFGEFFRSDTIMNLHQIWEVKQVLCVRIIVEYFWQFGMLFLVQSVLVLWCVNRSLCYCFLVVEVVFEACVKEAHKSRGRLFRTETILKALRNGLDKHARVAKA